MGGLDQVELRKINNNELPSLSEYTTSELVLGLVCAVGTDLNLVIQTIKDRLLFFDYEVVIIDVSDHILMGFNEEFKNQNIQIEKFNDQHEFKYDANSAYKGRKGKYEATHEMMDVGNALRGVNSGLIGMAIIERIQDYRKAQKHEGNALPKTAFIIKSLKNEAEVNVLRAVYGNGFYLFGVYSDEKKRLEYLESKRMDKASAKDLIDRDENEEPGYGQHTRDTFQMADFFVNYEDSSGNTQENIRRIMDLIFGDPFITPTFGEYAMFSAYCASLRTADLSRQIGAVICKDRDILASGANECPQYGGGQYWLEYDDETHRYHDITDGRDYMRGYDSNKIEFHNLADESFQVISSLILDEYLEKCSNEAERQSITIKFEEVVNEQKTSKSFIKALKEKTGLGNLTEYGRVVHAEMEALSVCARNGVSCRDTKLYCTTFPCHVCTKHIIAAGITKVVYIEPYPKSKSLEFYKDSISTTETDEGKRVVFTPFFGVGPRKFIELFSMSFSPLPAKKRKDGTGSKLDWKPSNATVRDQMLPSSYLDREVNYAATYSEIVEIMLRKGGDK